MMFKRYLLLVAVFLVCISLSAQFASFRSLSTAGLLRDDIEGILAVTEMTYVDGFNVYSNLSNFNYGDQYIFDGNTQYQYLVGMKGSMMDMIHLGILSYSEAYSYKDTSTWHDTYRYDTNGDEIYDIFSHGVYDEIDTYADNYSNLFGAVAFGKKEGFKFGMSYSQDKYGYSDSENDIYSYFDSNTVSNDVVYTYYDNWYNAENYSNSTNRIGLNGAMSMGKMEIALSFGFTFGNYADIYHENDSTFEDYSPTSTTLNNYYRYDYFEEYNFEQKESGIDMGLKGYYRINEDSLETGIGFSSLSYAKSPYLGTFVELNQTVDAGIASDWIYSEKDSGTSVDSTSTTSASDIAWGTNMKYVKKLEKAYFAMGIAFYQNKTNSIDTFNFSEVYTEYFDNGDGIQDNTDYTATGTYSYSEEYVENSLLSTIMLPVGIEYNIFGNVCARLGATTYLDWYKSYYSSKYFAYDHGTYTYTYGDGSTYEVLNYNPSYRGDYESGYSYFEKYTYYNFGLGWQISKNVKIDLMGFSDLTDMTNWEISANVKF